MPFITRDPIDLTVLMAEVAGPERGGTTSFAGSVRRSEEDGPVLCIDYSAYEPMLEAEFARIVAEAAQRWPEVRVAARHRLGQVKTGETSIAVAAGAPHRAEAFAVCRYVVEEAKVRLPVWKREIRADGTASWRDNGAASELTTRPTSED